MPEGLKILAALTGAALAASASFPSIVSAQAPGQDARVVEAERRSGEVVIDGRLDEAAWARAAPATGFIQGEPVEGASADEETEVRILHDEQAIYVGARMYDSDPAAIARTLTRRGEGGRTYDYFQVDLDSDRDRRTAYVFRVTAAGVQVDRYRYANTRSDDAWTAIWQSAVHHDSLGWSAEIRIPLSQLRYEPSPEPQTWGVNFGRRRVETNERTFFALESQRAGEGVAVYARLRGLVLPHPPRQIELRPYVLAEGRRGPAAPGDPFFSGTSTGVRAGADLRIGLGSTFVVDATVLPDFGQVEVDPAVINLSAFESFFPERRPFFTRDDRVFDFGLSGRNNTLFYSRRIGRSPQGRAPGGADFASAPGQTEILGAAKVTGRTAGGMSVGALGAWTAAAAARLYYAEPDSLATAIVEPPTGYGVLRARQDLRDGESQLGGIATLTERVLPDEGSLDWLPSRAVTAGADFDHAWDERTWSLSGYLAGSLVQGSPEALIRIQRSPNHYHQRPDADYLAVDSAAAALTGGEWRLTLERLRGRHWTGSAWIFQRTPGFEIDDIGFARGSERFGVGTRIEYSENEPGEFLRSYEISGMFWEDWRHSALRDPLDPAAWGRARKDADAWVRAGATFLNYWSVDARVGRSPEVLSDDLTRGGPLMIRPAEMEISAGVRSDPRGAWSFGLSAESESGGRGGYGREVSGSVQWRPTSATRTDLSSELSWGRDPAQYVTRLDAPAYEPTYGARYIFAELDRREVSLQARVSQVFSPTLTLELFAQPLISAGDYLLYRQLAEPKSFEFLDFVEGTAERGPDGVRCVGGRSCSLDGERYLDLTGDGVVDGSFKDRPFTVRSLRGNAVLRWEYRSGSTLYAVWQHSRSSRAAFGDLAPGRDFGALLDIAPENLLMIKVDYWIDL